MGEDIKRDAERYRKLREQVWHDGGITVVASTKGLPLGTMCLSYKLLDDALDDLIKAEK